MIKQILKNINPFNNISVDSKILYIIKTCLKYFLIYFIGLVVAEVIIIGLHYLLGYDPLNGKIMNINNMLLFKYYGYIICIFVAIFFIKKIDKEDIKSLGFNNKIIDFFKGSTIALLCLIVIIIILTFIGQIKFMGINQNVKISMLFLFFFAFIIQGTMEEVLCRGFLFKRLNKKLNLNISIIFSFLFFSYPHFSSLFEDGYLIGMVGVLNLLLVTYVFSYFMIKFNNIYASSGFHSMWNFILFNIIGLNLSGTTNKLSLLSFETNKSFLTGKSYGIEASIITSIILLIIIVILKKKK